MILCNDNHPEICFEDKGMDCPLCDVIEAQGELEEKVSDLELQIDDLQEKLDNK